jgi:hypothetical protein
MIGIFAPSESQSGRVTSLLLAWNSGIAESDANEAAANVALFGNLLDLVDGPVPGQDLPGACVAQPGALLWPEFQVPRHREWWLVLANLLESMSAPPARVTVGSQHDSGYAAVPATYDGLEVEPDFEFDDSSQGLDLSITVEFASTPTPAQVEAIEDRLDTWIAIGVSGGFRDLDSDVASSALIPSEEFEFEDQSVHLAVKQFTADQIAIDALLAMLGTLANEGLPVRRVDIR